MANILKKIQGLLFLTLIFNFGVYAQQTTTWNSISPSVWETLSSDGLVRVECHVSGGTFIIGNEIMGCTDASTYSDPNIFGSTSLEIQASASTPGTLNFYFFDAVTDDPVNIIEPVLHVDKVGTLEVLTVLPLFSEAATANFNLSNGTWTELSSNGPIFRSTPTQFNIDDDALLFSFGGECGNGTNTGTGGGSLQINSTTESIEMDTNVTGGLLAFFTASDAVEFVLSELVIANPELEVTKTASENFTDPVSVGDVIDYTITIENTGNVPLDNIRLNDVLNDADGIALTLTNGPSFSGNSLSSPEGTLEPSEVATYLASYTLSSSTIQTGGVINQVSVLANSPFDVDDVNDTSDDGNDSDGNTTDDSTESYFPLVRNDSQTVCENGTIDINVLVNDDFGGNGPSAGTIFLISSPTSGTAIVNDNGTATTPIDDYISYTSAPGYAGSDSFIYAIRDALGYTQHGTVTITEQALPDAGTDGSLTICEGSSVTTSDLFAELGGTPDSGGTWSPAPSGAGTYTYTVAPTSPCTAPATAEIIVSEQAQPNAGTDGNLTICEGESVTASQLFAQLGGTPDSGGTWSPALSGAGTYTYMVNATLPCTVSSTAEVVVTEQAAPNAGSNGTLTICEGASFTETDLFARLGGTPESGGTWSPTPSGAGTYTYTVSPTTPCNSPATSEVIVTEQAQPHAGSDGTLTICEGESVTATELFSRLGDTPDSGGTWSPTPAGAGTYVYTVTGNAPCSGNDTAEVTVSEQTSPNAGSNGILTICEGTPFTESDLFAQLGGSPDSGGTWSPTISGAGTYTYTVAPTSPCTVAATSEVVVVEQTAPNAGTNGNLIICEGSTFTENDLFAELGGNPDSGGTWSPSIAGAGTYTYTVSSTLPCTGNDTSQIVVTAQPAPDAGTNGSLTICEGTIVSESQLFAQLGGSPDTGGTWSPTLSGAGTYTYTVNAQSPCSIPASAEVTVTEQAAPNSGSNGSLAICEGASFTESDLFAQLGGTPDSGGTWSPAISGPGTYTYTVPASSPCSSPSASSVTVTEQSNTNAGTGGSLIICEGASLTEADLFAELGGNPDTGGTWSPSFSGAGTYTYTVAATLPCTGSDSSQVVVTEQTLPNAGTNGNLILCEGTTFNTADLFAQLGGTPDSGGSWSPAIAGAGTYTYTVQPMTPCTQPASSQILVTYIDAPDAGADGSLTVCEGSPFSESDLFSSLNGNPDEGGTWSPTPAGPGTYTYTVSPTAPCASPSTSEVVVTEQTPLNAGLDGILTICEGTMVDTNSLFASLGGTPDTGGTWSPMPNGAGIYTYTVSNSFCESMSATIEVQEERRPNAGQSTSLVVCPGITVSSAQLLELLGTTDTRGTWSPNPNGAGEGIYTYTVSGNACNQPSSASVTITVSDLDSDGDGVLDCDEVEHGKDPYNDCDSIGGKPLPTSDCDNDGLTEEEENLLGTDPTNPDTDGDGVLDGQEVTDFTDPLDPCDFLLVNQTLTPSDEWTQMDCDMDGLTNEQEMEIGTDLINPDTDGDTIMDGQEVADGTDPLDPCDSRGGSAPAHIGCELYVELDLVKPGDILNGTFQIINIERFPDNQVEIYNRWGVLVWETSRYDNKNNAFDGKSKGRITIIENQKLPSGVYFYEIKYVSDGEDKIKTGYLYVMR